MTTPTLHAVRKRPGMYVGSTGPSGLVHLVMEVVSNAFDEVLAGRATRIDVCIHDDGTVSVTDDGGGFRVTDRAGPTVEAIFTQLHDTPTRDGHWPHMHLALGGLGLGPACALSWSLELDSVRDEVRSRQSFSRGEVATALTQTPAPEAPTGTTITLHPDPSIFDSSHVDRDQLEAELEQLAHLTPGLTTSLTTAGQTSTFGPHLDLVPLFAATFRHSERLTPPILIGRRTEAWAVDVALAWETAYSSGTGVVSFANFRRTGERGLHEDGVDEGFRQVFGPGPLRCRGGVMGGLRAVLHVQLVDPRFTGPTRGRLASPEAVWAVADTIAAELPGALVRQPGLMLDLGRRTMTRERVELMS